ncbi:hypothetical protein L2E82_38283 [Cichorium intybus]|uniref:Uncharacterized protein n=1 Tax=Cichorium intybus TaxID=13427 RepID=A0ACB9AGE1_CICIN|nr:hypothetical protein L2E82_38283 [Cichorium intybus]
MFVLAEMRRKFISHDFDIFKVIFFDITKASFLDLVVHQFFVFIFTGSSSSSVVFDLLCWDVTFDRRVVPGV